MLPCLHHKQPCPQLCRGFETKPILPLTCGSPSALGPQDRDWDILLTAETHNFPCAVAPYPGACLLRLLFAHSVGRSEHIRSVSCCDSLLLSSMEAAAMSARVRQHPVCLSW